MPSLLLDLAVVCLILNGVLNIPTVNIISSIYAANRIKYSIPVFTGFEDRSQNALSTQFRNQTQDTANTNSTQGGFDSELCFTVLA